jgi:hypothetical protein
MSSARRATPPAATTRAILGDAFGVVNMWSRSLSDGGSDEKHRLSDLVF